MRMFVILLAAFMLVGVHFGVARDRLETNVDLQNNCKAEKSSETFRACLGFMRDAVLMLEYVGDAIGRSYFCAAEGHDFRRYIEIFNQWAAANPGRRREPAMLGVLNSLAQAFPCRKATRAE